MRGPVSLFGPQMKRLPLLLLPLAVVACGAPAHTHAPVAEETLQLSPASDHDDSNAADAGAADTPTQVDPPAATDDTPKDPPPADTVATKLDTRNGFLSGTFGDAPKAYKGMKAVEKKPDRATYKVGGKQQYAGVTLKDVEFLFLKGKLAKISFGVAQGDCKTVHDAIEREYGSAQKHVTAPMQADVWRGNDVGLRYNNSGTACSGVVIRRELATTEWTGLDQ